MGLFAGLCRIAAEFGGEKPFKGIKVHRLELAKTLHPDRGAAQGVRLQLAPFHPAAFFLRDEPGPGQNGQVLGNRSQRHLERIGHISDGHVVFEQHGQDRPPGGIGESGKDGIEIGAVSHPLALDAARPPVKAQHALSYSALRRCFLT